MVSHLRSKNIYLEFGYDAFAGYTAINQLWQTFRTTAVEPGQSSGPDFASFADECLLCARIVMKKPITAADDNDSPFNTQLPSQGDMQSSPSSSSMTPTAISPFSGTTVGLIYLHSGPANYPAGEANIGVITQSDMQHRGYAREAVQLVLRWAFEELKFHRVQAAIIDTPFKDRALRLFIGSGFAHEGIKRRSVFQPEGEGIAGMWKDVTYLAMLDTEWMLKSTRIKANRAPQLPVASAWDEMFARHAREQEELLRWEEKHGRMTGTSSTETLREYPRNAVQDMAYLTDDVSQFSGSPSPSPKPKVIVTWEGDTDMADDLGADDPFQRWEDVVETSLAARRHRQRMGSSSPDPSLHGHMLALPSIPSTRLSEGDLQSPLTIPTLSSSGSEPPFSPSPSPAPSSSVHSSWSDTEDEDDWLPTQDPTPMRAPISFTARSDSYPPPIGTAGLRTVSRSSSVSSSSSIDSWSDAQSNVSASSSSWDVVSDAFDDHESPGRA